MKKNMTIFKNFAESEKAERDYYRQLSPEERLSIADHLRREYQRLKYGSEQRFQRVFRIIKQA